MVWVDPIKDWYSEDQLDPRIKELMNPMTPDFELIIMYPVYKFDNIHKDAAIMTMYEADKCPAQWSRAINHLGIPVICPSNFVGQMFKNSGVKVPLKTLTLGIDQELYQKKQRYRDFHKPFRFLTVGKMEARKNVEATVRCFQEAFKNIDDVELLIKTREYFLSSAVKVAAQKDKRIRIFNKTVTESELVKLYDYCDAFVYPSRGEGFAFPPRNAIANGMPTMVTDWSALQEIDSAIKVKITSLSPMFSCGFSYGQEKELHMADIDEADLVEKMQKLVQKPAFYDKIARETFKTEQDSWQDCAENLVDLVEHL